MATVYTWYAGAGSPDASGRIDGHPVEARVPARERDVETRASARERDVEARVSARERDVEARVSARERDAGARVSARERDGDGRSLRERNGDGRSATRDLDARVRERDGELRDRARERDDGRAAARERGALPRAGEPLSSWEEHKPSAEVPDWSREYCATLEWNPSRQLLRSLRDYTEARERGGALGLVRRKLAALRHRFWSVVTGAEIPLNSSRIAGGLLIPHPNGIVLHPEVVIGPNCLLFQQVTLGTGPRPGVPKLGGNIDVGPGAKILGGVSIGDHAVIGANAVVLHDVAPGAVVVGVPAVPKKRLSHR